MNCDFNHGLMRARGIERCAECGELTPEKVETSLEGITRQRDALKAELDKALEIIAEQRKKIDLESLSRNIRREVQDALCNVRMIPVFRGKRDQFITEVRNSPANAQADTRHP